MRKILPLIANNGYLLLFICMIGLFNPVSNVHAKKFEVIVSSIPIVAPMYSPFRERAMVDNPGQYGITIENTLYSSELLTLNNKAYESMLNGDVSKLAFIYLAAKNKRSKERDNLILSSTVSVIFPFAIPVAIYSGLLRSKWGKLNKSVGRYLKTTLGESNYRDIESVKKFSPDELRKVERAIENSGYDANSFRAHTGMNHQLWSKY